MGDAVSDAIERFDAWTRPWTFAEVVSQNVSRDDRPRFAAAWLKVCRARYWRTADFAAGGALARAAVAEAHPELSVAAVDALVNAAAYLWR